MHRYFGSYGMFLLLVPFVMAIAAILVLVTSQESIMPVRTVAGGNPAQGVTAILNYGCGTCHTIPGVPGANGRVGPPLMGFSERSFIAGVLANNTDNLVFWIQHPQVVKPGNGMPDMNVTEPGARDIVAYLYSLR